MKTPSPQIMVIFGASGDLTARKLLPALYDLYRQHLLPDRFAVVGVGRKPLHDDVFRTKAHEALSSYLKTGKVSENFLKQLYYVSLNTSEGSEYVHLKQRLEEIDGFLHTGGNYVFYLATPPVLYGTIVSALAMHGLNGCESCHPARKIIVEKPFGTDYRSAVELNKTLLQYFQEDQIYRIDHYLGKETVQNVLVTRFSNVFFETVWNSRYIERVEITAAEHLGVEGRAGYYDAAGALRDMVQNHLMQLVAMVAMESPALLDAESIRNEMVKVFYSLRPYAAEDIASHVVRGQYAENTYKGQLLKAYIHEEGVPPTSTTETYVAMKLFIDNWRWGGVPFYLRTGKRMPATVTEIALYLKPAPHQLFRQVGVEPVSNVLILRIQPDEGIALQFGLKVPGSGFKVQNVNMTFHYASLGDAYIPSAYERLLLDCMNNDATLYIRSDALEATWKFVDPVLAYWKEHPEVPLHLYPAGTWGPEAADALFIQKHHRWRSPCKNLNDELFCAL